jgi:16S rRNA (uracil1498-N3)-methyltransferase
MSLRRIYSRQPLRSGQTIRLEGDAASHITRVLRLRIGDTVAVFDGGGWDYEAEITALGRGEVSVRTGAGRTICTESPADITLLQGICRGPRMDAVVQKATELGVTRIEPMFAERSVLRLEAHQLERKQEHWLRVAISACEQCGRARIPGIGRPRPLATVLAEPSSWTTGLLLDPSAEATLATSHKRGDTLALLVGPEGGLTEAELRLATDSGFRAVRLGPRILRTETAPVAALAILQFLVGDLAL